MPLRGIDPATVTKRLKMFLWSQAGMGKTYLGLHFPKVYMIDTERGAENQQYMHLLSDDDGRYFSCNDLYEICNEVRALVVEPHGFRTLMIDSSTVPYNNAVDLSAKNLARKSRDPDSDGMEFGRHKLEPDRAMKRLFALCTQLDMNVIMTAQAKPKWEKLGGKIEQVGYTFDSYVKMDYLFDLVVEVQVRAGERVGVVHKSRIDAFPLSATFPLTYDEIARRYGREDLERGAGAVELATADQVAKIKHLVDALKIEAAVIDKWMTKANAESFDDFTAAAAAKVLDWLEERLKVPHEV